MTPTADALINQRNEPDRPHALPSGRSVVLRVNGAAEELEVRSPTGEVEVLIALTERGPVVRLRAARLELDAAEDIALHCRRLEVRTTETTDLQSDGELRLRSEDDLHLNGKVIHLN